MLNLSNIKLGKWDLHDLVDDKSTSAFANLVNDIKKDVKDFEASRQMLSADLDTSSFEGLVHKIENITEAISTVNSFAQLKYAADTSSNEAAALVLETEKLSSQISNQVLFFDLWFKKELDDNNAQRLIDSLPLVYWEYLKHKRLVAKYSLNES
ncbi:MAG TPA: oligoendopeptidase F, partial [Nitrososphaeraceae archaeon]